MLESLVPLLQCPVCLVREKQLELHTFTDGVSGHVRDGVLACRACNSWYPIEEDLLELVRPALLYEDHYAAFVKRFHSELQRLDLLPAANGAGEDISAQSVQRRHFDWYANNADQSYNAYQNSPFWKAFDAATFSSWKPRVRPGGVILDVGCADGRSCFQFIDSGSTVVGMDISKSLVRQAILRAQRENAQATTTFFVADASALPFRDNSIDYVVIYGVLHHVPDPAVTCREAHRVLKPGGIYFGSENNVTIFRGLFDLLMKLKPIWHEEAGEQALISKRHIEKWLLGLSPSFTCRSSVFLPPQLINLLGYRRAGPALALSDKVVSCLPGLRDQGGLIVFEVCKK